MEITTKEILDRLPKEILDSLEEVRMKYSTKSNLLELAHFLAIDFESRDMFYGDDFINDLEIKQALHLLSTSDPEYVSYDEFKNIGKIRSNEEDVESKLGPLNYGLLLPAKKESINKLKNDSQTNKISQKTTNNEIDIKSKALIETRAIESQQITANELERKSDKSNKKSQSKLNKIDITTDNKIRNTPLENSVVVRIHIPEEDYSLITLLARKAGLTVPGYFLKLYQIDPNFQKLKDLFDQ